MKALKVKQYICVNAKHFSQGDRSVNKHMQLRSINWSRKELNVFISADYILQQLEFIVGRNREDAVPSRFTEQPLRKFRRILTKKTCGKVR